MTSPTKKEMKEYRKYLEDASKLFRLSSKDLSNLYSLFYMITWQDYERVFKPNKMHNWFKHLFDNLEEICLADSGKEQAKVLKKLMENKGDSK